jgi:lipopolysaccharide transport system permease protein
MRSLWGALHELYDYRETIFWLSVRHVKSRYKQTLLGGAWAIVQPVAVTIVFTLVFSRMARITSDGIPYPIFSYSGLLFWTFFSTSLATGSITLVTNADLLRKVYFPREALLIAAMAAALIDLLVATSVFVVLMWYYGVTLAWSALLVPVLVLVQATFTLGLLCVTASLAVHFRDIAHVTPLALQVGLLLTPVAYPLSAIPSSYREVYLLNPLAGLVESYRHVLLHQALPPPDILVPSVVVSLVTLLAGYAIFKRAEIRFADVV